MAGVPTGTVTFLFTDIEGSTRLAQAHSEVWEALRERHHAILQSAMDAHHGYVFQIIGDAFCVAFHTVKDGLNAAVDAQRKLQSEKWGEMPIKVRMGLHTGAAELHGNDYRGYLTLARVQRVMSTAYGGQILLSNASAELIRGELPDDLTLRDMQENRLKGLLIPEHLWQVIVPDLLQDFPPLTTLNQVPNNLPVQLTSFIGREKEIHGIVQALSHYRLVTLTGIGGTGKTRLSLQVAAELMDQYPDGVWFIELAPLTDPDLVPHSILAVLHYGEQAGKTPLQVLEEQLGDKKLLLILDNCEHLIEASAKIAHSLLTSAREIKILASSREALAINGELAWHVPSLALPNPNSMPQIEQLTQYESVRLFIERALLVQPRFRVDLSSAPAIAQICFRLDGIPLAIELAAARVKVLSVDQIAKRLDDRFRLLTGGSRVALERHQTLRATVDWSYNLLSKDEKRLLCRLSVFSGGWTLEAAEQVCVNRRNEFEVLDLLSRLVDKSLVISDGAGGDTRYHMLETTRQYAREKFFESDESEMIRKQHLAYFLELAEKGNDEIKGPDQAEAIDLLDAEHDNFRSALDWSVSCQNARAAAQLLGALGWAWDVHGYYDEVFSWFDKIRVLRDIASYSQAYARLLNHIGRYAVTFYKRLDAYPILEESHVIWLKLGSLGEYGLAEVLCFLGMNAANNQREFDKAISFYKQSLELAQKCNNQRITVASKLFWGDIEYDRGNTSLALDMYEQSLELAEHVGDLFMIGIAAGSLAYLFGDQGNYEKARSLLDRQLGVNQQIQFRLGLASALIGLGDLHRHQHNLVEAEQFLKESLHVARDLGLRGTTGFALYLLSMLALHQNNYPSAAWRFYEYFAFEESPPENIRLYRTLTGMSAVAAGRNQYERCARLLGAAQAVVDSSNLRIDAFDCAEFERHIQIARDQLGNDRFDVLGNEGRTMTMEQALALALPDYHD